MYWIALSNRMKWICAYVCARALIILLILLLSGLYWFPIMQREIWNEKEKKRCINILSYHCRSSSANDKGESHTNICIASGIAFPSHWWQYLRRFHSHRASFMREWKFQYFFLSSILSNENVRVNKRWTRTSTTMKINAFVNKQKTPNDGISFVSHFSFR